MDARGYRDLFFFLRPRHHLLSCQRRKFRFRTTPKRVLVVLRRAQESDLRLHRTACWHFPPHQLFAHRYCLGHRSYDASGHLPRFRQDPRERPAHRLLHRRYRHLIPLRHVSRNRVRLGIYHQPVLNRQLEWFRGYRRHLDNHFARAHAWKLQRTTLVLRNPPTHNVDGRRNVLGWVCRDGLRARILRRTLLPVFRLIWIRLNC